MNYMSLYSEHVRASAFMYIIIICTMYSVHIHIYIYTHLIILLKHYFIVLRVYVFHTFKQLFEHSHYFAKLNIRQIISRKRLKNIL